MFTIDDIQIFITTHNRSAYLKASIESVLAQTAGVRCITVLDNESTDDTEAVVASYAHRGVGYVRTTGWQGNFKKAQALAEAPYVLLFHDDDLLNPAYLETVLHYLNHCDNVSLIAGGSVASERPESVPFQPIRSAYLCPSVAHFALSVFMGLNNSYPSTLYKTANFKTTPFRYDTYGKIADRVFVYDCVQEGQVLLLDEHAMHYRLHSGQDINAGASGPFVGQFVNLIAYYAAVIAAADSQRLRFLFECSLLTYLCSSYGWMRWEHAHTSFLGYFEKVAERGILPKRPPCLLPISTSKLSRWFYKNLRSYLKRAYQKSLRFRPSRQAEHKEFPSHDAV